MKTLCFGTFAQKLKDSLQEPNTNQSVAEDLFNLLTNQESVKNKNGEPIQITPQMVSRLFNFDIDVHKSIVSASTSKKVIDESYVYFTNNIVEYLNPHKKEDLIANLKNIIFEDNTIAKDKKHSLLSKANLDTISEFLADTFLYAINQPNKDLNKQLTNTKVEISTELVPNLDDISKLKTLLARIKPPAVTKPPDKLEDHEMAYVRELLAAYGDAEGIGEITKEELPKYSKYSKNFIRQRKSYYAAESIRRFARDSFSSVEPNQFETLKEETLDGVVDVCESDYPNGFIRLNNVMEHVTKIDLSKCLLIQIPGCIGNNERKGICHILVNEGEIGWVDDD